MAAGEDKSWKVRLAFAKNFSNFASSFGIEITDNNLIQTFAILLGDNEPEVRLAAIDNISLCLEHISIEKFTNLIMPNLNSVYQEGNAAFKASVANALVHIAVYVGKDMTE